MPEKQPYKLVVKFDNADPDRIARALGVLRETAGEYDLIGESTATVIIESSREAPIRGVMDDFEIWLFHHAPGLVKDQGLVLYRPGLRPETAELLARERRTTPMDKEGWEPPADETEVHEAIIIGPPLALPVPGAVAALAIDGDFSVEDGAE